MLGELRWDYSAFLVPNRGKRYVIQAEHTLQLTANEGGTQVSVHGADLLLGLLLCLRAFLASVAFVAPTPTL